MKMRILILCVVLTCWVLRGLADTVTTTHTTPVVGTAAGALNVNFSARWEAGSYSTDTFVSWINIRVTNSEGTDVGTLQVVSNGNTNPSVATTGEFLDIADLQPGGTAYAAIQGTWTLTGLPAGSYTITYYDVRKTATGGYVCTVTTSVYGSWTPNPTNPPPTGSLSASKYSLTGEKGGTSILDWLANYASTAHVRYTYSGPEAARFTGWTSTDLSPNFSGAANGSLSVTLPINASTMTDAKHTFILSGENALGTSMTAESGKALSVEITVSKSQKKPQPALDLIYSALQYYNVTPSQVLSATGGAGTGAYSLSLVSQSPAGIATLSGSTNGSSLVATGTGTGTVVIQVSRNGDNEYLDATPIQKTVEIAYKDPGTITADPDPTGSIAASTTSLSSSGGNVTISWGHGGSPTSATIAGQGFSGSESVLSTPSGSRVVTLPANSSTTTAVTYTWTINVAKDTSHTGHTSGTTHPTITKTATVTVNPVTPSGDATLTANGSSSCSVQLSGGPASATIAWSSSNVQDDAGTFTVTGQGLSSTGVLSGSQTITYTTAGTYTYTLSAVGLNGTPLSRTAIVTVNAAPTQTPSSTLSLTASPTSLSASGGTTTLTWTNDGTTTELAGTTSPTAGTTPTDFVSVSVNGSTTVSLPANGTTAAKTYYFRARGNGSVAGPVTASVTVAGQGAVGILRTVINYPAQDAGSCSNNPIPGQLYHTNYTFQPANNPGGSWTFSTSPVQVVMSGRIDTNSTVGLHPDYELTGFTVSPAGALVSWTDARLDPSSSSYNPKAWGEGLPTSGLAAANVCQVNFLAGNDVTVTANVVKKPLKTVYVRTVADLGSFGTITNSSAGVYSFSPSATSTGELLVPTETIDFSQTYYSKFVRAEVTDSVNGTRALTVVPGYNGSVLGGNVNLDISSIPSGGSATITYYYRKHVRTRVKKYSEEAEIGIGINGVGPDSNLWRDSSTMVGHCEVFLPIGGEVQLGATFYDTPDYAYDEDGNPYQFGTKPASDWKFEAWLIDGSDKIVQQTPITQYLIPNKETTIAMAYRDTANNFSKILLGVHVAPPKSDGEWVYSNYTPTVTIGGVTKSFDAWNAGAGGNANESDSVVWRYSGADTATSGTVSVRFPARTGMTISPSGVVLNTQAGSAANGTWDAANNTYTFTSSNFPAIHNISVQYLRTVDFTISNTEQAYDGTVKKATVTPSNTSCVEGTDYEVLYDGLASVKDVKRVGSMTGAVTAYQISIRMKGDTFGLGTISGSTNFRITPKALSFTWAGDFSSDWASGVSRSVTATPVGIVSGESAVSGFSWNYSGSPYVRTATNAGSYTALAYGQGNYAGEGQCSWTIKPKAVTFTYNPTSFTYSGAAQGPTVTPSDASATWQVDGTGTVLTGAVQGQTKTDASSYSFRTTATGNYTGSSVCNWSIAQLPITFTITGTSHTYDGSVKTVTVTPKDGSGNTVSAATYTVVYTPRSPTTDATHKASGSYDVTVVATGNYSGSGAAVMTIEEAAGPKITEFSPLESWIEVSDQQSPAFGKRFRRIWIGGGGWRAYLGRSGVRFQLKATAGTMIDACELQSRWGAEGWKVLAAEPINPQATNVQHEFSVMLDAVLAAQPLIPKSFSEGAPKIGVWSFRARVKNTDGTWSAWSEELSVDVVLPLESVSQTLSTVPPAGGLGNWFNASAPKTFTLPIWIP